VAGRDMSPEEITERALRGARRMYRADRFKVALDYLMEALDADPRCYEALVFAGDIYSTDSPSAAAELGLSEREAAQMAIAFYDRAIQVQPDHAEAYAEKILPLLDLEEYQAAIECADQGLKLFDARPTTDCPKEVWTNIGKSLYGRKSLALKNSGRTAEGRRVLEEGLSRFPGSWYLTQTVDEFLPGP
jgi:tetratricopeptide (TPR) repeat protein